MILNRKTALLAAILALAPIMGCGGSSSGATTPSNGGNAYVAVPEANGVASYRVDTGSGDLKAVLGSPFAGGTSPISIVVHPSGKFIYAANQGGNDVSLFTVNNSTGQLTEVLPRAMAGLNPSSLALGSGGTLLFAANLTSNSISVYSVNSTNGTLTAVAGSPFPTGSRPVALAVSPSGKFLYVACSSLPQVFGYTVASGGSLQSITGSPFAVGNGPSSLVVTPSEHFLYVANFIDDTVSGLNIDPTTGALTEALDSPFTAGTGPFAVTVDPTGATLYVTNISSNNVSAYTIDASTGATTMLEASPFAAGTRPVSATVDSAGAFLYVCNQSSKNITKFQINPDTGGLPSSSITATTPMAPSVLVLAK
jgi:6-phosphogluconolactonase